MASILPRRTLSPRDKLYRELSSQFHKLDEDVPLSTPARVLHVKNKTKHEVSRLRSNCGLDPAPSCLLSRSRGVTRESDLMTYDNSTKARVRGVVGGATGARPVLLMKD